MYHSALAVNVNVRAKEAVEHLKSWAQSLINERLAKNPTLTAQELRARFEGECLWDFKLNNRSNVVIRKL